MRLKLARGATLKRIGGDDRLQSWIFADMGQALFLNGRFAEGLAAHRQALQAKLRVLPADHWDVALSVGSVASGLQSMGRHTEALEQNQRAIAILERAFGRRHPDVALHIVNRGEIRLSLGQVAAARSDFEEALEIWRGEFPPDHLYNGYPLTGIGLAVLAGGRDVADAIPPLERALKIREDAHAAPEMRATTMLALARALWQAGPPGHESKERALRLAEGARELFPANRATERREAEQYLAVWHAEIGRTGRVVGRPERVDANRP